MIFPDYLQPKFYQFSEDSIHLTKWLRTNRKQSTRRILDLGAGCGVIGYELSQIYNPDYLVFVELQNEFREYLEKNEKMFCAKNTQVEIIEKSFSEFLVSNFQKKFDLIVSNPPYYDPNAHLLSPDKNKTTCRFFIQDNYQTLVQICKRYLDVNGEAYILIKDSEIKFYKNQISECKIIKLTKDVSILHFVMDKNFNK